MKKEIWAEPKRIKSLDDCAFYHTMELPEFGTVQGEWDLRGNESAYIGNVEVRGKRVLEIGTASGHLCFSMEKMGAQMVAFDLSDKSEWDIVPYANSDHRRHVDERKEHIRQLNNGYWLAHRLYKSQARVAYGTVYELPEDIGEFDICTFGSILLHLRDPFLALQRVLSHVKESVVVTDIAPKTKGKIIAGNPIAIFLPRAEKSTPIEAWWRIPPRLVAEFLQILGFIQIEISYHEQLYRNKERITLYTIVGHRQQCPLAGNRKLFTFLSSENPDFDSVYSDEVTLNDITSNRILKHLFRRGVKGLTRRVLRKG
jgi:2-polyprenyl-3-methyl-5-hydroxy-6-metoxy-1,4-benzoquinol methylase